MFKNIFDHIDYYRTVYGEEFAHSVLVQVIDFWYQEDRELVNMIGPKYKTTTKCLS